MYGIVVCQRCLSGEGSVVGIGLFTGRASIQPANAHPPCLLQHSKVHVLDTESFEHTFGAKSQRRRPRLQCGDLEVSHTHTHMHTTHTAVSSCVCAKWWWSSCLQSLMEAAQSSEGDSGVVVCLAVAVKGLS